MHEYLIEDRWILLPTRQPMFPGIKSRVAQGADETIIQIVKPPREFYSESSIRLRELWQSGQHYFPVTWQAPPDLYRYPVVIIEADRCLVVIAAKHKPPVNQDFKNAEYVAIVELNRNAITYAVKLPELTKYLPGKLLGVFKRQ